MAKARELSAALGARVKELREEAELSQGEFGSRLGAYLGTEWARKIVWAVEAGKRPLSAAELFAVAQVLECTVSDLVAGPVTLGGDTAVDPAALIAPSSEASVVADGLAAFNRAATALDMIRTQAAVYDTTIRYVRARVAASPRLEKAIRRRYEEGGHSVVAELEAWDEYRRNPGTPAANDAGRVLANATPLMITAVDAIRPDRPLDIEWRRLAAGKAKR